MWVSSDSCKIQETTALAILNLYVIEINALKQQYTIVNWRRGPWQLIKKQIPWRNSWPQAGKMSSLWQSTRKVWQSCSAEERWSLEISVSPARHSWGIQYSHSGDSFFPAQLISEMELLYDFKFVQDKCSVEDCGGLEICFKVDTGVTSDDFSNWVLSWKDNVQGELSQSSTCL